MLRADGYGIMTWPHGGGKVEEHDYFWCAHCGKHTRLPPPTGWRGLLGCRSVPEYQCKLCMGFICSTEYYPDGRVKRLGCEARLREEGCRPHEEMLLQMEGAINRRLGWERNFREMRR